MKDRLQFGEKYKAYGIVDGKIEEYEVELAEISHYRARHSEQTLHSVIFWINKDREGRAWLTDLTSRPTSLPTGYLLATFKDECGWSKYATMRLITFDRELLEGGRR